MPDPMMNPIQQTKINKVPIVASNEPAGVIVLKIVDASAPHIAPLSTARLEAANQQAKWLIGLLGRLMWCQRETP